VPDNRAVSERNAEVVRRIWSLWSEGARTNDPKLLAAPFEQGLISPDSAFRPHPDVPGAHDRDYVGIDGLREFVRAWTEEWRDWRIELEEILRAADDHVIARIRQSAVGRASGAAVEFRFTMVLTFVDGQVTDRRDYGTVDEALAAAGHL
jgi:ketosteroid isomerase-like protein